MNAIINPGMPTGARSLHDATLRGLPNQAPRWLVGGSLLDNTWQVATDDPARRVRAVQVIDHDAVVAPGNGRLSDHDREHDLVTSKLYAYQLLEPPNSISARTTAQRVGVLHWLIRWREDAGLHRMADLSSDAVFLLWAEALRNGRRETVDWDRRVPLLLERLANGAFVIPTRESPYGSEAHHRAVARELGISWLDQLPDRWYWRLMQEFSARGLLYGKSQQRFLDGVLKDAVPTPINRREMASYFGTWEFLWAIRDVARHDPIGHNPFRNQSTFARAGAFASDRDGRTGTAPEEQVCFLVDRALRWTFDYAPGILATLDGLLELRRNYPSSKRRADRDSLTMQVSKILATLSVSGPGAPENMRRDYYERTGFVPPAEIGSPTFAEVAFSLLPTACAIVIATFTARRREEIASLRAGCVEHDADGEPWLATWIEKTLRDIDRIPIPLSVVRAVEVLEKLSQAARETNGTNWLFEFTGPIRGNRHNFRLAEAMKEFADYVGVPALPNGKRWNFAPHQFRRFFAIVYYHRFRYASLTALSDFLRHYDPDMTRRYVSEATKGALAQVREAADAAARRAAVAKVAEDREAAAREQAALDEIRKAERSIVARKSDFDEGRIEAEFARMWAVASGQDAMGGHKGEELKRGLEELILAARRQAELAPPGTLDEGAAFNGLLSSFVRQRWFEPHPQGHSYCGCGRSDADLAAAACLRKKAQASGTQWTGASGPDLAYADALTCSGCPHNIQMTENRAWWEDRLRAYLRQSQTAATDHLGHASRVMADGCAEHIVRCFDQASPMTVTLGRR